MPRSKLQQTPGDRLRAARRAAGLTQVEAAGRAGVSQGYWSDVERGRRVPSLDWIVGVAAPALGCKPGDLDERLRS